MFRLRQILNRPLVFVIVTALTLQLSALTSAPTVHAATTVKVFVGLLGGGDWQKETYDAVAKAWNNSHGDIHLEFEYHFYNSNGVAQAQSALRRELAGKEPPDIIGPIGVSGANLLPPETWADLAPMISADPLSKENFSENAINYYKAADGKILALATGVYPGMLFVNESLFDKAGVPLPPKTYGVPYKDKDGNSKPWDWDTLAEVAKQVTTDKMGKHPDEDKFNKNAIDVYGFASFWLNFRDAVASFGAENAGIADDGKTATFDQPAIQKAVQWYQDGTFKSYFIPNDSKRNMFQRTTTPFESGKLAMWYVHSWYLGGAGNGWSLIKMRQF
jgi:ABC-type glycerol-3-phosphate transport system substrate-binding protein